MVLCDWFCQVAGGEGQWPVERGGSVHFVWESISFLGGEPFIGD